MKKQITLACSMLIIGIVYFGVRSSSTTTNTHALKSEILAQSLASKDTATVRSSFETSFQEREAAMLNDIHQTYGISPEFITQQRNSIAAAQKKSGSVLQEKYHEGATQAQPETVQLVHEIAQTYGIQPSDIHVVAVRKGPMSAACASGNVIAIDEQYFNAYPRDEQRFIIAHELCHVLHNDSITMQILKGLLPQKTTPDELKELLNRVSRFQEERADLFGMIRGTKYANGALQFCKKMDTAYGRRTGPSHPLWIERYNVAESVSKLALA